MPPSPLFKTRRTDWSHADNFYKPDLNPFLSIGVIIPHFKQSGKEPVCNDPFTISVIGSSSTSMHCFNKYVGIGSRQHD